MSTTLRMLCLDVPFSPERHTRRALGLDLGFANLGIGGVGRLPDGTIESLGVQYVRTKPCKRRDVVRIRAATDDARRAREHWDAIDRAIRLVQPHVIGIENYHVFDSADVEKVRASARRLLALFGLSGATKPAATAQDALRALSDPNSDSFERLLRGLEALQRALAIGVGGSYRLKGRGVAAKTLIVQGLGLAAGFAAEVPVLVYEPVDLKRRYLGRGSGSKDAVATALAGRIPNLSTVVSKAVASKDHSHVYDATGHALSALVDAETWDQTKKVPCDTFFG